MLAWLRDVSRAEEAGMRKRYVVGLSEQERALLRTLIGPGPDPRPDLAQGQPGRGRPGLDRPDDRGCVGGPSHHRGPRPAGVRHRRVGCRGLPQAARARVSPDPGRRAGGPPGRAGLQRPARGAHALDVAAAGRPAGRAAGGGHHLVRDGAAGLEANRLKPWRTQRWCIPPEHDAEFVWRMEDVLAVYTRASDPSRPQVCLDETSRQLLGEVTPPQPVAPGRPARADYEYQRNGACNLFLVCEPLAGWRHVLVSARRTRIDWAACVKELVDVHYPDAETIVLVQDNLEHPYPGVAVRGLPARRSQAAGRQAGAALHAQARQLAEHGRDRAERARRAVPGPPAGRPGHPGTAGHRMAGRP